MRLRVARAARRMGTIIQAGGWGGRILRLAVAAIIAISTCVATTAIPAQAQSDTGFYNWDISPTLGDMCMGTSGGHDDTDAVLWQCEDAKNQFWQFSGSPLLYNYNEFYTIKNDNGDCLGTSGGNDGQGTKIVAWSCLGPTHTDQYWEEVEVVGWGCQGYWALVNYKPFVASGGQNYMVVGVDDADISDGTDLVLWNWQLKCNNQAWSGPNWPLYLPSGIYIIHSFIKSRR